MSALICWAPGLKMTKFKLINLFKNLLVIVRHIVVISMEISGRLLYMHVCMIKVLFFLARIGIFW